MPKLIYVAGKFSGTQKQQYANTRLAVEAGAQIILSGHSVIIPHLSGCMNRILKTELNRSGIPYEDWLRMDLSLILRCDAVYLLPNWPKSTGARLERSWALAHQIPVLETVNKLLNFLET